MHMSAVLYILVGVTIIQSINAVTNKTVEDFQKYLNVRIFKKYFHPVPCPFMFMKFRSQLDISKQKLRNERYGEVKVISSLCQFTRSEGKGIPHPWPLVLWPRIISEGTSVRAAAGGRGVSTRPTVYGEGGYQVRPVARGYSRQACSLGR